MLPKFAIFAEMASIVSVIIPVYNVEEFLPRCLDSVKAQSISDWEAICVDDGSNDNCPSILDSYAQSDSRFKVIHKKNGGLSDARNAGMEAVTGEYVVYLDSDDFLHPQALEICRSVIERDRSEMVAYTYDRKYRTTQTIRHLLKKEDTLPRSETYDISEIESMVTDSILDWATEAVRPKDIDRRWAVKHCQVWRCMYRTSLIQDIKFIKGINYEDFPWWSEVLLKVGRTSIINLPLYYYYPNPQSYILSSRQEHRVESLRIAIAEAEKLYETADPMKAGKWRLNFLIPFRKKLEKKEAKLKASQKDK